MIGSLFAGTNEDSWKINKKKMVSYLKVFRGMGSVGAMNKGSADRYFQKKTKRYVKNMCQRVLKVL